MFRIHNRRLFWRLAGRSIRANLSRHLLTALAVFLSTVMLFSIFTIGVNYFRNLQVMMDRLDGVTDAILHAPTQEQYEQVQATPGVEVAGIRIWIGQETIPGARGFEIPLQHWYYTFRKTRGYERNRAGSHDTNIASDGEIRYYKVKKGDSLSRIAKLRGVSVSTLCKLNRITTKTTLRPGQVLRCS